MNEERVTTALTVDEHRLLGLIRSADPDCDFEVNRRDGKIVNVLRTTIHRREFDGRRLQEPRRT